MLITSNAASVAERSRNLLRARSLSCGFPSTSLTSSCSLPKPPCAWTLGTRDGSLTTRRSQPAPLPRAGRDAVFAFGTPSQQREPRGLPIAPDCRGTCRFMRVRPTMTSWAANPGRRTTALRSAIATARLGDRRSRAQVRYPFIVFGNATAPQGAYAARCFVTPLRAGTPEGPVVPCRHHRAEGSLEA